VTSFIITVPRSGMRLKTSAMPWSVAGTATYAYNAASELTGADTAAGNFTYSYDSGGDLAATSLDGAELSAAVWDLNNPLPEVAEDTTSSGAATGDYAWNPDGTLNSQTEGGATGTGTTYYAATDWEGSVTGLASSTGTQVSDTNYTAYGTASTTGTVGSSIGYTGSYALTGSSLDSMRARDYNPATGEFTSVDPALSATDEPYAYTGDNPADSTDPSGLIGIGACDSTLVAAGVALLESDCLVVTFNWSTGEFEFGGTTTKGVGLGMVSLGISVGPQFSNANQISDYGGWFGDLGGSGSLFGAGVGADGFTGLGSCNQQIWGGSLGVGPMALL
jgi:RHS repeat-associated protein